ncbi:MAG: DUF1385 domain-containing protein [candidate division Zixibacteria bacterium]|nr:DUF1385 domain-containing protein [candidate division Zixibacteria bacterium]
MNRSVEKDINVGGQAVLEGVMMRSSQRVSTAVRKQSGEIVVRNEDYTPLSKKYKLLSIPVIRGIISFVEMLVIGIRSLNFSADVAVEELEEKEGKKKKKRSQANRGFMLGLAVVLALALSIFIFFFLPLFFSSLLKIKKEALAFNLVAGAIRVAMFLLYVWIISRFKDFKRIFEYHGAEHKSIYAYEAGEELTSENIRKFSTKHPRCGTSFILIVAIFAILVYSVSDTTYTLISGIYPSLLKRFLIHFTLLPLVAGGSYELLKLSGKTRNNPITRIFSAPGIWLQKITTQEPDDSQLEVAIAALENALGNTFPSVEEDKKIGEKI